MLLAAEPTEPFKSETVHPCMQNTIDRSKRLWLLQEILNPTETLNRQEGKTLVPKLPLQDWPATPCQVNPCAGLLQIRLGRSIGPGQRTTD